MKKKSLQEAHGRLLGLEFEIEKLQDNDAEFKSFEDTVDRLWEKYEALGNLRKEHFEGKSLEKGISDLISDAEHLEKQARNGREIVKNLIYSRLWLERKGLKGKFSNPKILRNKGWNLFGRRTCF